MKWPIRIVSVIVTIALIACVVDAWYVSRQRAHQRREETYQMNLQRYSNITIPGMTRKQVEGYLRNQSTTFQHFCCIDEHSAMADLVLMGRERAGFPCDNEGIYIAFQFAAAEHHDGIRDIYDSDVLKKVSIFRWPQGCL